MSAVRVVCRFRPLNQREQTESGQATCCTFTGPGSVKIGGEDKKFDLDRIFPPDSKSKDVYEASALPIIEEVLRGYNGTVFAYGQTGSGKTFTMEGIATDPELQGIIPRMVATLFETIDNADENIEFTVKASIVEIYLERIRDLIDPSKDNLKVHEDKVKGIYIGDVTEEYVTCEQDVFDLLNTGHKNRVVAATNMNAHSSRGHLLFNIVIQQKNLHDASMKTGKLYLVDLAGSEKVGKTGVAGSSLEEAKMINKSLSALGNVINALTDPTQKHVPYRDSKLTRILTESLGGNAKTCLIVACSPSVFNEQETISTLRFGARAKNIKNNAKINQERSVEELKMLLEKAEATIGQQRAYIVVLEQTIEELGGEIPKGKAGDAVRPPAKAIEEARRDLEDDANAEAASTEQMITLMDELCKKNEELRDQSEQISDLKRQVAKLTEKMTSLESENTLLVNRIADSTVASEQTKYEMQEISDTNEQLAQAKKSAESELEVIRENHKQLLDQLQEKDGEIDQLSSRLTGAVADLAKLKTLVGTGGTDLSKSGVKSDGTAASQVARITEKLQAPVPESSAAAAAAIVASDLEALSKEELHKHVRALERHKLYAVEEAESLRTQNATMRALVYGDDKKSSAEDVFKAERKGYEEEMASKAAKLVDLEMALLEERERNAELKETMKDGERPLKRKVAQLDRNLEQLTIMYHKLVSQNSGLKVECQVNEKKLTRKEQRIVQLEKSLKEAKTKYEKLLQQCANLTNTVETMYRSNTAATSRRNNMQRPMKGGGMRQRGSLNTAHADHAQLALQAARQVIEEDGAAAAEAEAAVETE